MPTNVIESSNLFLSKCSYKSYPALEHQLLRLSSIKQKTFAGVKCTAKQVSKFHDVPVYVTASLSNCSLERKGQLEKLPIRKKLSHQLM